MLRPPPNGDPYLTEMVKILNAELARIEPAIVGLLYDGIVIRLRFRAASNALFVRVHVQSSAEGEGGGTFDPVNYKSSTLVDCRANRVQDVTISGA